MQQSRNRFVAAQFRSGKYKTYVAKGELVIALCGFPIDYCGPHIGVRHDGRLWKENLRRCARLYPWEYVLGDKAYVACDELLCEFKKPPRGSLAPPLTAAQIEYNLIVQHYRARVEHMIGQLVCSRKAAHEAA